VSSIPEVGAVCGKAARTDLCGGREATRVPTAKAQAPTRPANDARQRAQVGAPVLGRVSVQRPTKTGSPEAVASASNALVSAPR
jgi:hypothetical protein